MKVFSSNQPQAEFDLSVWNHFTSLVEEYSKQHGFGPDSVELTQRQKEALIRCYQGRTGQRSTFPWKIFIKEDTVDQNAV